MATPRKRKFKRDALGRFARKTTPRRKKPKPFIPDPWYFTPEASAFFGVEPEDIEEAPEPLAPIITEVGTGFEEEFEFDDSDRLGGSLSEYFEEYFYDREDFDEDQDDPYDF